MACKPGKETHFTMDIPVYLVAGFLDSGKTNFINGVLEDGFARREKTLLLR